MTTLTLILTQNDLHDA